MKTAQCRCGAPRDPRAELCRSCRSKIQTREQWADPVRASVIRQALHDAGVARRPRYGDLTEGSFWLTKKDGRRYARYWDEARWRYVYRYRWRWEQAHGAIPEGMEVHHRNEDTSDDRLSNLELRENADHRRLHSPPEKMRAMRRLNTTRPVKGGTVSGVCPICETPFERYRASGQKPPRFCSRRCAARWREVTE